MKVEGVGIMKDTKRNREEIEVSHTLDQGKVVSRGQGS
jgi:hypothetical protein